jgi:FtsP/CotA-like multicopper oxidase with cupredoxin domain
MGDEAQQLDMGLSGAFIIEPSFAKASAAAKALADRSEGKPDKEYTLIFDEWQTTPMDEARMQHSSFLLKQAFAHMGENNPVREKSLQATEVVPIGAAFSNGMNMSVMMGGGHMMDYNLFTINGRSFPDTEPIKVKRGERVRLRLINGGTSTIHPMHLHGHQFKIVAVDGNAVPPIAQLTRNTLPIHPGETYDIEFTANNPGTWLFHCHELHHADGGMIVPIVYE